MDWSVRLLLLQFIVLHMLLDSFSFEVRHGVRCQDLQAGQYICNVDIDNTTQEIKNCTSSGTASVNCEPLNGLTCEGQENFKKDVPCVYTNNKSYRIAVLLSIFMGMFGADRFYLGYYAIGLLKLCTMGLLFVGQFVDFILIATQVVTPADGSGYVMDYAPRFSRMWVNNETYFNSDL